MRITINWKEYGGENSGPWPGFQYGQKWYFLRDLDYDDYFESPTSGLHFHWIQGRHYLIVRIKYDFFRPVAGWATVKKF